MVHSTPRAFPPAEADSGIRGFRPHLQRRDREGFAPSSLTRSHNVEGTVGDNEEGCQVQERSGTTFQHLLSLVQRQQLYRPVKISVTALANMIGQA